MRILMNQVFQVKRLKRELKAEQEELEKKRQYRKEKAENKMPRLSNLKWDENKVAQDLKLTDELTSTLRELVPEGSVMTERYQVSSNQYLWYFMDNDPNRPVNRIYLPMKTATFDILNEFLVFCESCND